MNLRDTDTTISEPNKIAAKINIYSSEKVEDFISEFSYGPHSSESHIDFNETFPLKVNTFSVLSNQNDLL